MKTYKYIQVACMVALMGATTGCADDALVQVDKDVPVVSKGKTITVQASVADGGSRVTYNEGESKMTMIWEENDSFSVYVASNTEKPTTFTIENGAGTPKGEFTGTPETAYQEGDELYVIYPAVSENMSLEDVILDLSEQDGTLNGKNQYMYAKTTFIDNTLPTFQFNHLTSIVKMNLEFPTNVTEIKQITVKSYSDDEWWLFNSQQKLDFNTEELVKADSSKNAYIITGDLEVVDNKLTAYAYLFNGTNFSNIQATDAEGNVYTNGFVRRYMERGKMYRLHAPMIPATPLQGNGTEESPYEIANLSEWNSVAAHIAANLVNENGLHYREAHYKMTADIHLLETDIMYPIGVHTDEDMYLGGVFDGDNHKITGTLNLQGTNNMYMGLFPVIGWATIRNLHLQATQGNIHDPQGAFGSIVGRMIQGRIQGCTSTMDLTFDNSTHIGGLVGISIDQMFSTIEGSSYSGTITATREGAWVGGIVAELGFDGKVYACSTLGRAENVGGYGGGIAGLMKVDAQIVGCWSDMVMSSCGNFGGIVGKMCDMDESTEEWMLVNHCFYYDGHVYPVCGLIEGGAYNMEGNGRLGDDSMGGVPNAGQIEVMNAVLAESGCQYQFDEQGLPCIPTSSNGSAGGSNFGDGGEF